MSGGDRVEYSNDGMEQAKKSLSQLTNSTRVQSHYNANIKDALQVSTGQSAEFVRRLNATTGEIVKEFALLNELTLTLAHNIQSDFTDLDDGLSTQFRESF